VSRIALISLLVLIAAVGCKKENASGRPYETHAASIEGATAASDLARGRELTEGAVGEPMRIRFERQPCYGLCPSYVIDITESGALLYEGKKYVLVHGEKKVQLTTEQMDRLKKEFERVKFFTMTWKDPCDQMWTDNATVITTLVMDGRKRTIEHYHGNKCFPPALEKLENAIDDIVGAKEWTQCKHAGGEPGDTWCTK